MKGRNVHLEKFRIRAELTLTASSGSHRNVRRNEHQMQVFKIERRIFVLKNRRRYCIIHNRPMLTSMYWQYTDYYCKLLKGFAYWK